ncbi:YgaP family membrane protein [Agaribacter marinus]|uniref:YgaP family membrane protein n=1 Tax=Agaribacter marinus TaxID=1431249 RepID=UPI003D66643F
MFTPNLNSIDRILRLIIGIAILSLAFFGPQSPWAYIGIILILTAFINFCPLYRIFGLSTRAK